MRQVSPGRISLDSSPERSFDEDAHLLVRVAVLGHDAVRCQFDEAQRDSFPVDGSDDDAVPDLLRRD
jgi:hypothetical protein